MPYSKIDDHDECSDSEIAVVKDDGELMGCHVSEEAADDQIAALNASEGKSTEVKGTELGTLIRSAREEAEMSRADLEEEMTGDGARAASTIGQIENGEIDNVPDEALRSFAAALSGLTMSDLEEARDAGVPEKTVSNQILEHGLAAPGGEAKAMEDGKVGGYLVRFTEPGDTDIDGDFFTEETDFGPRKSTTVLYHHGQDKTLKRRVLDPRAEIKMDETGVWVETQLDRRDKYEEAIYQMAKAGKLGWSSGTASHLVERERSSKGGYHVKSWHLGVDASLTPTPTDPRNEAVPVNSIKSTDLSSTDIAQEVKAQEVKAQGAKAHTAEAHEGAAAESPSSSQQTTDSMSDQTEDETKSLSPLEEYKAGLITKNEYRETKGLDALESGDVTADEAGAEAKAGPGGGKTVTTQNEAPNYNKKTGRGDSAAKAFKHWAQHGDASGLPGAMVGGEARPDEVKSAQLTGATKVHVSPETDQAFKSMKADQDMLAGTDAQGGNAVPEGHFNNIISRRDEMMLAEQLGVRDIPGQGTTVDVPIDDNTSEEFTQTAEAAQNDRDTPTISNVAMTLDKYTKRVPLTNELMQDEASRLMSFIEDYVGRGQAKTHNDLLVTEVETNGTTFTTFSGTDSIAFGEPEDILADDDLGFYLDDSESVSWVTRNSTLWSIKSLTGNDRQYDRGLFNEGTGKELLGYPVRCSNKVQQPGTTNKPLLFGNFNYVGKREEPGFTVLRDPYSRAEEGIVQLHYYFRTVYKVLQSEAVGYGQNA